ncbi:hypothetical protein B0A49_03461, partial [Cryomyces minteri]
MCITYIPVHTGCGHINRSGIKEGRQCRQLFQQFQRINDPHDFFRPGLPFRSVDCAHRKYNMLSPRNTIANGSLPLDNSVHVGFVQDANFRSTFDLVWSCLVTMALCTWTVQRPSVPSPSDSDSKVLLRKAAWAALTIAAPDALTLIAAEEFFGAREQVKRFHEHGYAWWTMSHAFFGYMGG